MLEFEIGLGVFPAVVAIFYERQHACLLFERYDAADLCRFHAVRGVELQTAMVHHVTHFVSEKRTFLSFLFLSFICSIQSRDIV